MAYETVVFVHLSDIHFYTESGSPDDLNDELRDQLLRDAPMICGELGQASAILVSGDIAARGKEIEYQYARDWLDKLSGQLGVSPENVLTIPGNHDVDRSEQENNEAARLARLALRSVPETGIDAEIARLHKDPAMREALYRPLVNYNRFARPYGVDGEHRWWDASFDLVDGSRIVVRGVNSALVSDETDHHERARLVVGQAALMLREHDDVVYVLMCHHPPRWLRDRYIDEAIACRAKIQLFGHEHDQKVMLYDNTVRLFSGALHPERIGSWQPQYNIVRLEVCNSMDRRILRVEIRSRFWSRQAGAFVPDPAKPEGRYTYELALPIWSGAPSHRDLTVAPPMPEVVSHSEPATVPSEPAEQELQLTLSAPERKLAHRFYRLTIPRQWDVVRRLGYLDLSTMSASSAGFFNAVFTKARDDRRLGELWDLIREASGGGAETNPFEGR